MSDLSNLERELLKRPLVIPKNDWEEATISLGGDELLAFFLNAGFTGVSSVLGLGNLATALSGPVGEKFIFLGRQSYRALQLRKETPKGLRQPTLAYLKEGVKEGVENLVLDITLHDPTYTGLMYYFLENHSDVSTLLALPLSFVAGLVVATVGKVGYNKGKKLWNQHSLTRAGMEKEVLYEVRFIFPQEVTRSQLEENLFPAFGLEPQGELEYQDIYFPCKRERTKIRLRDRDTPQGERMRSAQVVLTTPGRVGEKDQPWNCYPSRKIKYYLPLSDKISDLDEVPDENVRKKLLSWKGSGEKKEVRFRRSFARNSEGLLIAMDQVFNSHQRPFYVLEAKVFPKDLGKLVGVTQHIMYHYARALMTTYGKHDLSVLNS
ncbi:MAG: hypothetical protein WCV90_06570 [Candidatus Woesearchaeota archaeon]|jgi:hypothetical protein